MPTERSLAELERRAREAAAEARRQRRIARHCSTRLRVELSEWAERPRALAVAFGAGLAAGILGPRLAAPGRLAVRGARLWMPSLIKALVDLPASDGRLSD